MLHKGDSCLFSVVSTASGRLAIYKNPPAKGVANSAFCTINNREIFFGKGVIPIKSISRISVGSDKKFEIYVNENTVWNEAVKKRHPIRWRLRLISRSESYVFSLGICQSAEDEAVLIKHFNDLGVKTEYSG